MNNLILIAKNQDLFKEEFEILSQEDIEGIPVKTEEKVIPNESSYIMGKAFISFGITIISIIIIVLILLAVKKFYIKGNSETKYKTGEHNENSQNELQTPASIDECIKKFLKRTL